MVWIPPAALLLFVQEMIFNGCVRETHSLFIPPRCILFVELEWVLLLLAMLAAFAYYGGVPISSTVPVEGNAFTRLPGPSSVQSLEINVSPILPGSSKELSTPIVPSGVLDNAPQPVRGTVYLNPVLMELNRLTPTDSYAVRRFLEEFNVSGRDVISYSWSLLSAEGKYFTYDEGRASAVLSHEAPLVLSPARFLQLRRGICSDYAVFTAVALYLGGYCPLVLDVNLTGPVGHAAVAVDYNGHLFVLDQHLPLWPLAGYCRRPFDKTERIRAIYVYGPRGDEINSGFALAREINCVPLWYDTDHDFYLSPAEIQTVSRDVNLFLSGIMVYSPQLTAVARSVLQCQLRGGSIGSCTASASVPCPGMYFYSQLFDEFSYAPETADLLVRRALSSVPQGYTKFGYAITREVNGTHEYYVVGVALGRC